MRVAGIPRRGISIAEAKIEPKLEPNRSTEYPVPDFDMVFFTKKAWFAHVNSIPPRKPGSVTSESSQTMIAKFDSELPENNLITIKSTKMNDT